jgi:hypothetical protein
MPKEIKYDKFISDQFEDLKNKALAKTTPSKAKEA